ncbi:sugar (and other) transporter family protein [Rhodococcus sp. MTM3W5.2]|uniref:MFS transporter n=1 Tax=Rhodococcus sp. MTM3W5.2 TaxID=1805827 RepID=UPI0009790A53|nr:MFS transporter [Rhodococcus sp. MTM3W5.2]AQA23829.1 sugar (and other) transporter family protein [Rhodococcus sp. MTM3W5.2]
MAITTPGDRPTRAPFVLLSLIIVAAVANLNLAVANVALPDIGKAFDASQTQLNLIAVGYSVGLAASVLYLGALGDRYGRKTMLVLGMVLSIPASLVAAFAPNVEVLFLARLFGGISAGLAFPTTLALITALWSGAARTKAIALWSAIGGGISALGPLASGALLQWFEWGSVFFITLPLALIALVLAITFVPSHVNESTDPVDHLGGMVSVVLVAALVLGINFAPVDGMGATAVGLLIIALAAGAVFVFRQLRAPAPLFDLRIASRRIFWVAAVAGIVVFGTLMGTMYIGQQFMQNVLGYSTLAAGSAGLPAAAVMVLVAPQSAKLVESHGARLTLLLGYTAIVAGLLVALLLWKEDAQYWKIALGYIFLGIGVGLAGTPASRSLTGSVPVSRAGMASGTADLQRDLGGAIVQSVLGALLTAGYTASFTAAINATPEASQVSSEVESTLEKSFAGAANIAERYPQYAEPIMSAARSAFLDGDTKAYAAAILIVLVGAALVFFAFPKRDEERNLLARYHETDTAAEQSSGAQ